MRVILLSREERQHLEALINLLNEQGIGTEPSLGLKGFGDDEEFNPENPFFLGYCHRQKHGLVADEVGPLAAGQLNRTYNAMSKESLPDYFDSYAEGFTLGDSPIRKVWVRTWLIKEAEPFVDKNARTIHVLTGGNYIFDRD